MGKHAYLIMIHEKTPVLLKLIESLDYEGNDIYIHADKKMPKKDFGFIKKMKSKGILKYSNLYFIDRKNVYWATTKQTLVEWLLLKKAVKKQYDYYHLISGADLPIKSQQTIHNFFESNKGKEFIHFGSEQYQHDIQSRFNRYHFFVKQLGRDFKPGIWNKLETYSDAIQRRIKVNRIKNKKIILYGGANWFSISHEFAKYVVDNFDKYYRLYRFTRSSDESIIQTILMNSPFCDKLYLGGFLNDYKACAREIDWERGNPYIWKKEDYKSLLDSPCMFARKFDSNIDSEIVNMLCDRIKNEE